GKPARAATDPNGPTGRLATWLADTTLDDIPPSVREHAKHLLLDGIACALVGAQLPIGRDAQFQLHPGVRTRRLPPSRPSPQQLAGHPRYARGCPARGSGVRGSFSAGR